MKQHVHILGASGAGTTTIAKTLCGRLGYAHFDTDDYFWMPAVEPYTITRAPAERVELLARDLEKCREWVLSGSLMNWGNSLIPRFDLVVFVYVPTQARIERLQKREHERYGGGRPKKSAEFLEWAAAYDEGTKDGRSLQKHRKWLEKVPCKTLHIVNNKLETSVNTVLHAMYEE